MQAAETVQFKLKHIRFVMLGVTDLTRAVAFYRDKLGLSLHFQSAEFAFLDGGGVTLALGTPLARAIPQIAGATEIVFGVEDVMGAYEALRARDIKFIYEPRNVTGTDWAAVFEDPDGHKLSVFGAKEKPKAAS